MRESLRVSVDQLRGGFQAEDFPFETTDEIESLPHVIFGQKRAERASEFGLKVKQEGYNLFMVGPSGSGKTAYALAKVNEMAKNEQTPEDWCYVYNFESPDHPVAISFPAGQVSEFKQEIETLVEEIRRRVKAAFVSEDFETKRKQIHKKFNDQAEEIWKELENYVKEQNFGIEKTAQGIVTAPLRFGRPISKEEFNAMSEAEREALNEKGKEIEAEVTEAGRRIELVERQLEEEFNKLRKATARESVESLFSELAEKYKDNEKALVSWRREGAHASLSSERAR